MNEYKNKIYYLCLIHTGLGTREILNWNQIGGKWRRALRYNDIWRSSTRNAARLLVATPFY